jgi:hypothetical protein
MVLYHTTLERTLNVNYLQSRFSSTSALQTYHDRQIAHPKPCN